MTWDAEICSWLFQLHSICSSPRDLNLGCWEARIIIPWTKTYVWEPILNQMIRMSRCIVLLKNIWPSGCHSFDPRLHYIYQNVQIHFFCDSFPFFKEMWWHDITLTGYTQHVNIGQKFRSGNNRNTLGVVGEPSVILPIDFGLSKSWFFFVRKEPNSSRCFIFQRIQ